MCAGSGARHRLKQTCLAKAFQAVAEACKLPAVRLGDGRIALHGDYSQLEIASNMVSMAGRGTAPERGGRWKSVWLRQAGVQQLPVCVGSRCSFPCNGLATGF